jgi:KipI family sensor histidine kinase inhibitor
VPVGDSALVVELGETIDPSTNAAVHELDRRVTAASLGSVLETVPAYASLLLHIDPLAADADALAESLERMAREVATATGGGGAGVVGSAGGRIVEIPVHYGGENGPDLSDLAARVGLSEDEVVLRHLSGDYGVAMLGFAPGFPYLMGLDPAIGCPRLDTPRVRVPAGSVAIAETQTGVYPYAMPGGWRLIGRTDIDLFDPARQPPAAVMPGDRVRFVLADAAGAAASVVPSAPAFESTTEASPGAPALRLADAGIQATIQDVGRLGYQRLGVPPSGAADPVSLAAANVVVGNPTNAAAIEITAGGFEVEFILPVIFALAGAEVDARVDGRDVPFLRAMHARAGERLRLGRPTAGVRTYLAIGGGVDVAIVLGSRSTYLPAGFGGHQGRALRAGDELAAGPRRTGREPPPSDRPDRFAAPVPLLATAGRLELPFVPSGQWDRFPVATREAFLARSWTVSHRSDRMGLRLEGRSLPGPYLGRGFISDGTVTGAIQVSGDGLPIVLGVDRQTTGGYPKLGAVATAALHLLGQLQPGDEVTFRPLSVGEARARIGRQARR